MRAILHIGAAKCGTTAIQTALAGLRPQLQAAGLHYPMGYGATEKSPRPGALLHGNAVALGWLLDPNIRNPNFDRPAVDAWLRACIAEAEGRELLFSSEIMQMPNHPQATELTETFARAGYDVHIVYHARHAMDQSIAVYLQALKRGRMGELKWGSLENFLLRHAVCPYEAALAAFHNALPPERFMVRHYDAVRDRLVADFLGLVTAHAFEIPQAEQVINRSPTAAEQVVFSVLTGLDGGQQLCRMASDHLLAQPIDAPLTHAVSHAAFDAYAIRNQPIIDRMNAQYPSLGGGLRIKSPRVEVGDAAEPTREEVYGAFARCIAGIAARRLEQQRASAARRGAAAIPPG